MKSLRVTRPPRKMLRCKGLFAFEGIAHVAGARSETALLTPDDLTSGRGQEELRRRSVGGE